MKVGSRVQSVMVAAGMSVGICTGYAHSAVIDVTIPLTIDQNSTRPNFVFSNAKVIDLNFNNGDDVNLKFRFDSLINPNNNIVYLYQFGLQGINSSNNLAFIIASEFPAGLDNYTFSFDPFGADLSFRYEGTGFTAQLAFGVLATAPEPATWAMMLIGFAGLGYAAKFRSKNEHLLGGVSSTA